MNVTNTLSGLIEFWLTAYPVSIKDKRKLIRAKLHIWLTPRSGPAHSHVSTGNGLKFEVPLPGLHCVRSLYPKEADLINAEALRDLSCWVKGE